jgi:hypothetical protein
LRNVRINFDRNLYWRLLHHVEQSQSHDDRLVRSDTFHENLNTDLYRIMPVHYCASLHLHSACFPLFRSRVSEVNIHHMII